MTPIVIGIAGLLMGFYIGYALAWSRAFRQKCDRLVEDGERSSQELRKYVEHQAAQLEWAKRGCHE